MLQQRQPSLQIYKVLRDPSASGTQIVSEESGMEAGDRPKVTVEGVSACSEEAVGSKHGGIVVGEVEMATEVEMAVGGTDAFIGIAAKSGDGSTEAAVVLGVSRVASSPGPFTRAAMTLGLEQISIL